MTDFNIFVLISATTGEKGSEYNAGHHQAISQLHGRYAEN